MLTRALFALVLLLAACGPTSAPTPQEKATIVIVKSDVVLGEDGVELVTQPVCGGVAVGPWHFVTVEHCVGAVGTGISYVDSEKWRTTTDFFEDGTVQSVLAGVATVAMARVAPGYVGASVPAPGSATLVQLVDVDIATVPTELAGFEFDTPVWHGSSGYGIFQGEVVGLVDTCHAPLPDNGTECLETGGIFVPVLQ